MISTLSAVKRFAPRVALALIIGGSAGCLTISTADEGVAVLTVVSGNEQNVQVGTTAASPLVIRAFDNGAGPMGDVEVKWTTSPSSGGTVSESSTTTDETGFTQINFKAGTTPGQVFVRATADGLTISFTINVVAAPA
jgi:hypothetical protein